MLKKYWIKCFVSLWLYIYIILIILGKINKQLYTHYYLKFHVFSGSSGKETYTYICNICIYR